jgi:predicted DNA-binding helix-hairpin-helix protein
MFVRSFLTILIAVTSIWAAQAPSTGSRTVVIPPTVRRAPVDINRATKQELMALPAIGDAIADKIIMSRRLQPFKSKADLVIRGLLKDADYKKVEMYIIAKQ